MRQFSVQVTQIAVSSGLLHIHCNGATPHFDPGQIGLALADVPSQPFLRVPLHPFHVHPESFEFCVDASPGPKAEVLAHPYATLRPGDILDVLGPCGRGFDLPSYPAHLLLVAASPARLFGLIHQAVDGRWAVAMLAPAEAPPPTLPEQLELHRGVLTGELVDWADLIILDVLGPGELVRQIRELRVGRPAGLIQALIDVPMPCGTGACQACWVESHPRRKLACVDGPVVQY